MTNTVQTAPEACKACKTALDANEIACSICGFPQRGSEKERKLWVRNYKAKKAKLRDYEDIIEKGAIPLWIVGLISMGIGIFATLGSMALLFSGNPRAIILVAFSIGIPSGILYLAHVVFKKNPRLALIIAVVIFGLAIVSSLLSGSYAFVLYGFGLVFIIRGLVFEKKARELREEINLKRMRLDQ